MATLILDRELAEELRQQRVESGADRWDEVWEGTYTMTPLPNLEHQQLVSFLTGVLFNAIKLRALGDVFAGVNVSDQRIDWTRNYRCPDVAIYLETNPAEKFENHIVGGPDLAIEVVSPDDRSYEKIPFYESIGTRELLLIDRAPWKLELFQLDGDQLVPTGVLQPHSNQALGSHAIPITFRLLPASGRPQLEVGVVGESTKWLF